MGMVEFMTAVRKQQTSLTEEKERKITLSYKLARGDLDALNSSIDEMIDSLIYLSESEEVARNATKRLLEIASNAHSVRGKRRFFW